MSRKRRAKRGGEWIGGIQTLPIEVAAGDEMVQPEALLWVDAEGRLLGSRLTDPGRALEEAGESLEETMCQPNLANAGRPSRVRVASAKLAEALRAAVPEVEIVVAPTPELDRPVGELMQRVDEIESTGRSYLTSGVSAVVVDRFFRAAAMLHRSGIWPDLPSAGATLAVTCERFALTAAPLSFIGQSEGTRGFVLIKEPRMLLELLERVAATQEGEELRLPDHLSLSFLPATELPVRMQREIEDHGWPVAAPDAYPLLRYGGGVGQARPLQERHFEAIEALCLTLSYVRFGDEEWQAAFSGGPPVTERRVVDTYLADNVEITYRAPLGTAEAELSEDLLTALTQLAQRETIEPEEHDRLQVRLIARFLDSPEGAGHEDRSWFCRNVMDYAAGYFGATIATLSSAHLEEILFDVFPRKVSAEAKEAKEILSVLRDFYAFLERDLDLPQATACQRVLREKGVERKLEAALSDRRNFGMAKSLFTAGLEAGFDMESEEGFEEWRRSIIGKPLPNSFRLPGQPPMPLPKHRDTKAKKDKAREKRKRQSAKRSRKRNR